ncbi:hypoxia up-regulated protein 1-like isoform X2 [Apostichopus japonicus]|uniref:hypoxia up-regulated protein 1-like isoform X2 n=1 Tax=Stichopus japonicus TaxID=307972 RepID=UPI003AB82E8E
MLRSLWFCLLFGVMYLNICEVSGLATLSIDLSSEFLKVAIVKPGVPMEIVLNKESRRKTPLTVAFKDGETLLGDPALVVAIKKPKRSFSYFLHLLAKDLKNPIVEKFQKDYPHYTLGEDNGRVYFRYDEDTIYFPEELVAIALNTSREIAEDYAEQKITDAVITVPSFFNQAERKAVIYAAELAGLRVLQLMSDNAAVALNYGVFRRKEFNATVQHVMFFDMGAGSTTASIVAYQTVKLKEEGVAEINPQLTIKGVGFDRTLGGKELDLKLQAHLAEVFTKQKKTSNSVYDSPRAMAKLLKEAKRVKQVLSANSDHTAQIEGLLDDEDFKAYVSRKEFVEMTKDFYNKIEGVIERALKSADMTLIEIDSVILVGGGTRVPKVQDALLKATKKKELAKNINADEAAALGAVYQAAHLSKGFKVKKFVVKDASIFPIRVDFDKISTEEDGSESKRKVMRTLFHQNNVMPQKKVMTFNKHKEDFQLNINYGDLNGMMTPDDVRYFGSQNVSVISLTGIADALEKHTEEDSKGIKAHFRMDESGILHLDSVEAVFERIENVTVNETEAEEQSTFAKLGDTISRFFSGSNTEEKTEDGATEEEKAPEDTVERGDGEEDGDTEGQEQEQGGGDPKDDGGDEGDLEGEKPTEDENEEKEDKVAEETDEETIDGDEEESEGGEDGDISEDTKDEKEGGEEEEQGEEDGGQDGEKEEEVAEEGEKGEEGDKEDGQEDVEEAEKEEEDGEEEEQGEEKVEEGEAKEQEEEKKDETDEKDGEKVKKDKKKKKKKDEDKDDKDAKAKEETKKVKLTKPQIQTVKEAISVEIELLDCKTPSKEMKKTSKEKLKDLRRIQEAKRAKEQAVNNLESFIYETQEKLYEDEYLVCSLEEERDLIRANLSEASDWVYEVDADTNATVFKQKLRELKKQTKDLFFRVKEKKDRPELVSAMKTALNTSKVFLEMIKNITVEEDSPFSQVEVDLLEKVYNKSKDWFKSKMKEQKKLADHERPVLLTSDLQDKISDIDRELRYLVGKAKTAKPKKKPSKEKSSNKTDEAKKSNETKAGDEETIQTDLPVEDKAPSEGNETEPITEAGEAEDQGEQPTEGDAEEEPLQIGGGEEEAQLEEPVPMDTPPEEQETESSQEESEETTRETEPADATTEKETAHNSGDL